MYSNVVQISRQKYNMSVPLEDIVLATIPTDFGVLFRQDFISKCHVKYSLTNYVFNLYIKKQV